METSSPSGASFFVNNLFSHGGIVAWLGVSGGGKVNISSEG